MHIRSGDKDLSKSRTEGWTSDRDLQASRQASHSLWTPISGLPHIHRFRESTVARGQQLALDRSREHWLEMNGTSS